MQEHQDEREKEWVSRDCVVDAFVYVLNTIVMQLHTDRPRERMGDPTLLCADVIVVCAWNARTSDEYHGTANDENTLTHTHANIIAASYNMCNQWLLLLSLFAFYIRNNLLSISLCLHYFVLVCPCVCVSTLSTYSFHNEVYYISAPANLHLHFGRDKEIRREWNGTKKCEVKQCSRKWTFIPFECLCVCVWMDKDYCVYHLACSTNFTHTHTQNRWISGRSYGV